EHVHLDLGIVQLLVPVEPGIDTRMGVHAMDFRPDSFEALADGVGEVLGLRLDGAPEAVYLFSDLLPDALLCQAHPRPDSENGQAGGPANEGSDLHGSRLLQVSETLCRRPIVRLGAPLAKANSAGHTAPHPRRRRLAPR